MQFSIAAKLALTSVLSRFNSALRRTEADRTEVTEVTSAP